MTAFSKTFLNKISTGSTCVFITNQFLKDLLLGPPKTENLLEPQKNT